MGYIPPGPPQPGAILILDYGIEVTTLDDVAPRYVDGHEAGKRLHRDLQACMGVEHRLKMEAIHAETMRDARIGTVLLLALAVTLLACALQLAGVL